MPSASAIRLQIEAALAARIPSALTPIPRIIRPTSSVGISSVDELLAGGLPVGAITEIVGPQCSGRTSFALSFLSCMTRAGKVCAWIDVSNTLHPDSAAAAGVDLSRLLWVRCGVSPSTSAQSPTENFALPEKYLMPAPVKRGLHGGGFGPHPRSEVKGLSDAVSEVFEPSPAQQPVVSRKPTVSSKPWSRLEQALRVTDLLLQAGGFSAIVLDMGSITAEYALRVPLATWFRYRAAAERSQASIVLLTQHACAKSSAGLVLRLCSGDVLRDEATVFSGMKYRVELVRERFTPARTNVIALRKPPQGERAAEWNSRTTWAGGR